MAATHPPQQTGRRIRRTAQGGQSLISHDRDVPTWRHPRFLPVCANRTAAKNDEQKSRNAFGKEIDRDHRPSPLQDEVAKAADLRRREKKIGRERSTMPTVCRKDACAPSESRGGEPRPQPRD